MGVVFVWPPRLTEMKAALVATSDRAALSFRWQKVHDGVPLDAVGTVPVVGPFGKARNLFELHPDTAHRLPMVILFRRPEFA